MSTEWPKRIRSRAAKLKNGNALLALAEESQILSEMRRRIMNGEKPVTALSGEMVERFGQEDAEHHGLRQLAGEATAFMVESMLGAVRSSGSRKILDDQVFSSGTPFRIPGQTRETVLAEPLATELLVRHVTDAALADLAALLAAEQERRLTTLAVSQQLPDFSEAGPAILTRHR
ncbi:hypothetical protein ACFSOZ_03690 [Mesorhizobium newzealandense]|uniref:Uncharacterized protein n=3 Tax=Mesorhizobium TaxID=68287 RepID=A0ABW4WEJ1_9HYPH